MVNNTKLISSLETAIDEYKNESTINIDFIDHVHEFLLGRVLSQRPHHHAQLLGASCVFISTFLLVKMRLDMSFLVFSHRMNTPTRTHPHIHPYILFFFFFCVCSPPGRCRNTYIRKYIHTCIHTYIHR